MERLLEEISFTACRPAGGTSVTIDAAYVREQCRRAGEERRPVEVYSVGGDG